MWLYYFRPLLGELCIPIYYSITLCPSFVYQERLGESNRIRTVPEYGHYRYLRNHKSYKNV